jgi:hypothetical protein
MMLPIQNNSPVQGEEQLSSEGSFEIKYLKNLILPVSYKRLCYLKIEKSGH